MQDSTSYGAVARVYHELGRSSGLTRFLTLAGELTRAARNVHESFASWLPAAALGWTRDDLVSCYPEYRHHYDAMQRLVETVSSPYARFHAAHALARVCLQTEIIGSVLERGLERFVLADVRDRERPDSRFALLRRRPPNWARAVSALAAETPDNAGLHAAMTAPVLTADLFGPANEAVWDRVAEVMYDAAAEALRSAGVPVLDQDGHLAWTPLLVAAAKRLDAGLGIEPGRRRRPAEAPGIVLGNIERETFIVAPPLSARLLPRDTDPALMVADMDQPHLFLTHRPAACLTPNYALQPGCALPSAGVLTVARRTVREPSGAMVVELLELDEPEDIAGPAPRAVSVAALSALSDQRVRRWLGQGWPSRTALLLDLPLGPHLDVWLDRPGARFHYVFLRIESFGRVVPFLVGEVRAPEVPVAPLLLRPLSHAGVRVHKAALSELRGAGAPLVEDGAFLNDHRGLLDPCLAHLAGEEVRFGPREGAAPTGHS